MAWISKRPRDSKEERFLAAYEAWADDIFRFCLVKVRNRDVAVDLVQDTFIKTWQYMADKEVDDVRAFLYRVALNLIIDEERKKKTVSLDELKEKGYDHPAVEWRPGDALDTARALEIIETLDPMYRDVLVMRYVSDMTPKEIAAALGETQNTISVRIHRGLKQLQTRFHNQQPT